MVREVILYGAMFWLTTGYNYRKDTSVRNLFFLGSELVKCHLNSSLVTYSRITETSVLGCTIKCLERPDCGHVIFCRNSEFCYLEEDNGLYYDWTNFFRCSCFDGRELTNIARSSYCEASSVAKDKNTCNRAVDGRVDKGYPWASNNQGVGAWIKIYLESTRLLTHGRVTQRGSPHGQNKEIQLEFSDGSFQRFTLPLHISETKGNHISDALNLQPVRTSWVNITVLSVYSSSDNGWREVELFSPS